MDIESTVTAGWRHLESGELQPAETRFREALAHNGRHPRALYGLARIAASVGRNDVAVDLLETAVATVPSDADLRDALIKVLAAWVAEAPGDASRQIRIARAASEAGDAEGARDAYVAALLADPSALRPRWLAGRMLPRVYGSTQEIGRWRARFVAAIHALEAGVKTDTPAEAETALTGLLLSSNFELPYQAQNDKDVQEAWGRLACRILAARFPDLATRPAPTPLEGRSDRRLKVGYVSSYFHSHTIALLFNGWVRHADRERISPHLYVVGGMRDGSTETLLRLSDVGRDLRDVSLEDAARTIRADACDILVYPDLGMDARSFALAALPLAPQQAVSWGHPVTTGLPTMDWFLTSDAMEPDGGEAHYHERLVRLPRLSIAYSPARMEDQKDRTALGLPKGVLYLCCQAQQKYLPMYDAVFPAIAARVPDARFVFIQHRTLHHVNRAFRMRLEAAFQKAGIDPAPHLVFLPWQDWRDFLCLNAVCDVFLDSIGWSGGNTTLEALSRGLPPVTLPTAFMRGRHTMAMLQLMDMPELIAPDLQGYVDIAARLGREPAWRANVRARIVARRDTLYDDHSAVRALEDFYHRAHAKALMTAALVS